MQYVLKTPLSKQDLAPLKAGDTVLLSGVVYTARDAAHARMMELLDKGEVLAEKEAKAQETKEKTDKKHANGYDNRRAASKDSGDCS